MVTNRVRELRENRMVGISELPEKPGYLSSQYLESRGVNPAEETPKEKSLQPWISCHWTLARFFMRTDLLGFYP